MSKTLFLLSILLSCEPSSTFQPTSITGTNVWQEKKLTPKHFEKGSWEYYLQNLPYKKGTILDYTGKPIANQQKHFAVLPFDVGSADLQQCADALMRLRTEYLFEQKQYNAISFHFTNGLLYSFTQYCGGIRPIGGGSKLKSGNKNCEKSKAALRNYLNLVYMYAGTISLSNELKPSQDFGVGIIIIKGGSPGHCCIIIDEATDENGLHYYRLAEGYTPAQSIYILQNVDASVPNPWYHLNKGVIETSSYTFHQYKLGRFE